MKTHIRARPRVNPYSIAIPAKDDTTEAATSLLSRLCFAFLLHFSHYPDECLHTKAIGGDLKVKPRPQHAFLKAFPISPLLYL
jgi:hypothetical protein